MSAVRSSLRCFLLFISFFTVAELVICRSTAAQQGAHVRWQQNRHSVPNHHPAKPLECMYAAQCRPGLVCTDIRAWLVMWVAMPAASALQLYAQPIEKEGTHLLHHCALGLVLLLALLGCCTLLCCHLRVGRRGGQ